MTPAYTRWQANADLGLAAGRRADSFRWSPFPPELGS